MRTQNSAINVPTGDNAVVSEPNAIVLRLHVIECMLPLNIHAHWQHLRVPPLVAKLVVCLASILHDTTAFLHSFSFSAASLSLSLASSDAVCVHSVAHVPLGQVIARLILCDHIPTAQHRPPRSVDHDALCTLRTSFSHARTHLYPPSVRASARARDRSRVAARSSSSSSVAHPNRAPTTFSSVHVTARFGRVFHRVSAA